MASSPALAKSAPWWRFAFYLLATLQTLFALVYSLGGMMVGSAMGWGGRTPIEIALLAGVMLVGCAISAGFAIGCVKATSERRYPAAALYFALSFLGVPLIFILIEAGLLIL